MEQPTYVAGLTLWFFLQSLGLEDIQEADGAKGHTPCKSLSVQKETLYRIIQELFQPQHYFFVGHSWREND